MTGFRPQPRESDPGDSVPFQYLTLQSPDGPVNVVPLKILVQFLNEVSFQIDEDTPAKRVLHDLASNFTRYI